jgi:hypothetical protein
MINPLNNICFVHKLIKYFPNKIEIFQELRKVNSSWNDTISNYCDKEWIEIIQEKCRNKGSGKKFHNYILYSQKDSDALSTDILRYLVSLNLRLWNNYNIIIKTEKKEGFIIEVFRISDDKFAPDGPYIFINLTAVLENIIENLYINL